jgi:hypothetical protein
MTERRSIIADPFLTSDFSDGARVGRRAEFPATVAYVGSYLRAEAGGSAPSSTRLYFSAVSFR